jgi:hypothetical protein
MNIADNGDKHVAAERVTDHWMIEKEGQRFTLKVYIVEEV